MGAGLILSQLEAHDPRMENRTTMQNVTNIRCMRNFLFDSPVTIPLP
jgi:hypothetical protein